MSYTDTMSISILSPDNNLSRYLDQIKKFPMLEAEHEYSLAKDWLDKKKY
jgi:RNA polymerase sigma-32 factor